MSDRKTNSMIVAAVMLAATTAPAYAYIDPGTGSLALQALIGAVAGGMFAAKMWWARIASHLPGSKKKPTAEGDANKEKPAA